MLSLFRLFHRCFMRSTGDHKPASSEPDYRLLAEHSSDIVIEIGADRLTSGLHPVPLTRT